MARLLIVISFLFFLFAPAFALGTDFNPYDLYRGIGKVEPMRPPGKISIYGTREAEKEENLSRLGMGLKTILILFPEYNISIFFNKDQGLELNLGFTMWSTGATETDYSLYYKKLMKEEEKRRSFLALGFGGREKSNTLYPAAKLSVESGEYRGNNWIFEAGWPIILGLGFVYYY